MTVTGKKNPNDNLDKLGIGKTANQYWNLSQTELVEHTLNKGQGVLNDTGALVVMTGEFTGRSPKDKFTVEDDYTKDSVYWNNFNIPFSPAKFDALYNKLTQYFEGKDCYVKDAYACADEKYRTHIRLVSEYPWSAMFAGNMFLRPNTEELKNFQHEWLIVCAPGFTANAELDGTRQHNFSIINFTKKIVIIGGSAYTGEIKKGIFTVLNMILPHDHQVLSMHCSANIGKEGDTALFFGLSGTGKTTLSADPNRRLIGDDEHGWTETGIFNFEGGCYAKCIDLSAEKEPEIYAAIKHGAILENIEFYPESRTVDFSKKNITENTRVSYPLEHIQNAAMPSVGGIPNNIFFLTYDAFGVLPPISKLTEEQAMYYFISGFTSKVAGTEAGVTEPQPNFSACFGAPFLPLHPTKYASLLGKKLKQHKANVWMVNTGLTGGAYGVGKRMSLPHTRALITAALTGELAKVEYSTHPVFGLQIPKSCPGVDADVLNPREAWADKTAYDKQANLLAEKFNANFEKYADEADAGIKNAAPKMVSTAS